MTAAGRVAVAEAAPSTKVKAWDPATRLFHWTLVALIVAAYVTRTFADDPTLYWHRINGYAVLVLLLFRLLWGLVGSSTSRFASFLPWPGRTIGYARALLTGRRLHYLGHNPLGGALILVMLLAVAAQAVTGLFTSDDAIAQGPLHDHVSDLVGGRAGSYHAKGFWIILGLVAVHIAANLTYQFAFRDRLITSMVTGTKPAGHSGAASEARLAPGLRALACLLAAVVTVASGVLLAGESLLH